MQENEPDTTDDAPTAVCPACGHSFVLETGALQRCPGCGEQFFVSRDTDEPDPEPADEPSPSSAEKLDDRHIKLVQLERRTLYRARTYMLVLGFACLGLAAQLVWLAIRSGGYQPVAYGVVASILVYYSTRFFRRARAHRIAAEQTHLTEPTNDPDFSTMGDGSQFAEKLDQMTRADQQ